MSSTFEEHLEDIASELYGQPDNDDYYKIRNYVWDNAIRQNDLLSTMRKSLIPFGSSAHGIRLYDSDEYDVMIELEFPDYDKILVRPDQHRPGMVHLCFKDLEPSSLDDMLLDSRWYLKREAVHTLMQCSLIKVHDCVVRGASGYLYQLHYKRRANSHTITATSDKRQFSIDFVPAIKVYFKGVNCQVVPKGAPGPKRSNGCTFQFNNITAELELFEKGGLVIRKAVMLLKGLCEAKGLPKIRFYHLVSEALWFMDREDINEYSLEDAFLELLCGLTEAFEENNLWYYLYEPLDLLSNFKPNQIVEYTNVLNEAYRILNTYPLQDQLSYERCSWHFFGDDEEE